MPGRKEIEFFVVAETGCWSCISHKPDSYGYPRTCVNRKNIKIFRLMYVTYKGPIPNGLLVRHTCDNRNCINPKHLLLGTIQDNLRDARDRGRMSYMQCGPFTPKLTKEKVIEIRNSKKTHSEIARDYGIGRSTVGDIKRNATWKNIK